MKFKGYLRNSDSANYYEGTVEFTAKNETYAWNFLDTYMDERGLDCDEVYMVNLETGEEIYE